MSEKTDFKSKTYIIPEQADGMQTEQFLRKELGFSRAQIRSMKFRENGITVNNVRIRVSHILHAGDILQLQMEDTETASDHLETAEGPLEILYEDDDLIAVWKEAGLVVHPAHGHYCDTLSNRLHGYFQKKGEKVTVRSIGRLDRDTSGIVVFAKNQVAAARLWQQKEAGTFQKEYLAICRGRMEQQADYENSWITIDAPLAPVPGELMKMHVSPEGKRAVTHYRILEQKEDCTLIQVHIDTGRMHQIRVHMADAGHPLAGDPIYDGKKSPSDCMFLCAWKAELRQPFTGQEIRLSKYSVSVLTAAQFPDCI